MGGICMAIDASASPDRTNELMSLLLDGMRYGAIHPS